MSTFGITYGTGAFLGPGNRPTQTDTDDVSCFCDRSCANDELHRLDGVYGEGDNPLRVPAGTAWVEPAGDGAFEAVTSTGLVSWGDMPCATSEVDCIVNCEGCGAYLNATELESFDTHRRTVEAGFREVIGWATDRGMELSDEDRAVLVVDDDESLQWLFEGAEQYLNDLDGYRFEQDGDTATTALWARNAGDPALVK